MADSNPTSETLDAAGLACILPLSVATIRADVSRRPWLLPPHIKIGTRTVWLKQTVLEWLKQHERAVAPPSAPSETKVPHRRRGRPTKAEQVSAERAAA